MTSILFVISHFLQRIQMQLCLTQKTFSEFFASFLKCISNLKDFEKKTTLIGYVFPKLATAEDVVAYMSKESCLKTFFNSEHVKVPKTLSSYCFISLAKIEQPNVSPSDI